MEPAVSVLLAIVLVLIPVAVKVIRDLQKQSNENGKGIIRCETKLTIFLAAYGLDPAKVNRKIMDEMKQGANPNVGCINIKELYPDKEE